MSNSNRLALIAAIANGGITSVLSASPQEVKEETSLVANPLDNDNSTLDEGQNISLISPLMAERAEELSDKYGDDELTLTRAERKEIGEGKLFKTKALPVAEEEDSEITEPIDYAALAQWANEMAAIA